MCRPRARAARACIPGSSWLLQRYHSSRFSCDTSAVWGTSSDPRLLTGRGAARGSGQAVRRAPVSARQKQAASRSCGQRSPPARARAPPAAGTATPPAPRGDAGPAGDAAHPSLMSMSASSSGSSTVKFTVMRDPIRLAA